MENQSDTRVLQGWGLQGVGLSTKSIKECTLKLIGDPQTVWGTLCFALFAWGVRILSSGFSGLQAGLRILFEHHSIIVVSIIFSIIPI